MGTNGNGAGQTGDSGAEIEREPLVRIVDMFTGGLRDINQLHVDTRAKVAGLLIRAIGAQTEQIAKLRGADDQVGDDPVALLKDRNGEDLQ